MALKSTCIHKEDELKAVSLELLQYIYMGASRTESSIHESCLRRVMYMGVTSSRTISSHLRVIEK